MKLRNKRTGEIIILIDHIFDNYNSLAELNEAWEDYQEPKEHWYIYGAEPLQVDERNWNQDFIDELKVIGNYFETEEEAEKAVEKLKAWKRLKDKGFVIEAVVDKFFCLDIFMKGDSFEEIKEDLKIVFGDKDESKE